jgi:hypothetical protein
MSEKLYGVFLNKVWNSQQHVPNLDLKRNSEQILCQFKRTNVPYSSCIYIRFIRDAVTISGEQTWRGTLLLQSLDKSC